MTIGPVIHVERARACPDASRLGVSGVQSQVFGGYSHTRICIESPYFAGDIEGILVLDRDVQRAVGGVEPQVARLFANIYIGNWRGSGCRG